MQLQKLTTREPDLDQLAVAIAAMEAVLADETADELVGTEDLVGVGSRRLTPVCRSATADVAWRYPRPRMIESLVEQIEARFAELSAQMSTPR